MGNHQLTNAERVFLKHLFDMSFNNGRFKRFPFKRMELNDQYLSALGTREGFSEMLDSLVFAKLISMKSAPSGLLVEYALSNRALEQLAALYDVTGYQPPQKMALPQGFELTEAKQKELIDLLAVAETSLDFARVGNADKATARAYIVAAKVLADMPEPPVDLIWEIINRANQLSGIAALLVSIMALFVL